jgi:hypothetical protein
MFRGCRLSGLYVQFRRYRRIFRLVSILSGFAKLNLRHPRQERDHQDRSNAHRKHYALPKAAIVVQAG